MGCLVELCVEVLVRLMNSPAWGNACESGYWMLNYESGRRGVHETPETGWGGLDPIGRGMHLDQSGSLPFSG